VEDTHAGAHDGSRADRRQGGGRPANDASPKVPLEGDTAEEEGIDAAPEVELEGDAEAPEAVLEGGEGAPELELEGSEAVP
jgi:hypothetical protein